MSVGVVPKTTIYVVKSKYMFRKIGFCISNNHILGYQVMPKCKLLSVRSTQQIINQIVITILKIKEKIQRFPFYI